MAPIDPSKLTPEYLSNLTEEQQKALLEEAKAELAKLQARVKGQQRDNIKRLQKSIARHEAQLAFLTTEARKIDELLATVDPANDDPEYKKAVRTLTLGKTFFRAGRKMLAIQMQELRQDLATIATEITEPFEVMDPFSTYDYRRASAEGDLAAMQLMMVEYDRSHRVLAAALGVGVMPEAASEAPSGGGTAMPAQPMSRTIKSSPAASGPKKATTGSSLSLDDGLPPPADLPPTTVLEDTVPETEGGEMGEGLEVDPAGLEPPAATAGDAPDSAPEAAPADADPAVSLVRDSEEEFDVNYLKKAFAENADLARTAAVIADHLRETNGFIEKGLEYMGHIATTPPAEGSKLLDLHFWNKVNGRVYYLRRLPDQVADSILTKLFPNTPKPLLPFERPLADGATRPIATAPTDRLGLHD